MVKLIEVQFASTDQVSQLGSMGLDIWEVSHLDYIYLNGVVSGSVTYPSGFSTAGDYNVRLFFNDSYTLEASSDFTVE